MFVAATGMRPGFDPFGWMVWGHQVLYGSLNTSGAPSWKPLTFLFTLPYALFGHTQVWLWSVTSVTGTIAAGVFAGRVAYRLTGPVLPSRRFAPFVAGAFAGVAVMGIQTWPHLVLIANSDPLVVALLLAAIDAHLGGHPRWAFAALVLASLDRPESWAFAGCYGIWLFWTDRRARIAVPLALLLIPAVWFVVPGLTSKSWFSAGDLALNQQTAIHGSKIVGVLRRWRNLYELPMQLAFLAGVAVAIWRRDRRLLGVAATALVWVIVEIAFALHGWSAASRYLIEPAAVCIVVAAALVGQLLGGAPWVSRAARPELGVAGASLGRTRAGGRPRRIADRIGAAARPRLALRPAAGARQRAPEPSVDRRRRPARRRRGDSLLRPSGDDPGHAIDARLGRRPQRRRRLQPHRPRDQQGAAGRRVHAARPRLARAGLQPAGGDSRPAARG